MMKYFTYELISTANGWTEASKAKVSRAVKRFEETGTQYFEQLDKLESRISKPAFKFFRYGFAETGLHDARLLSFRVGDGLDFVADGSAPFRRNYQKFEAIIELLNFDQDRHYLFKLKGLSEVRNMLHPDPDTYSGSIGDLYTYELTSAPNDRLRIGLLFASGAEIEVTFKQLVFRMNRIKKSYDEKKTNMYS